VIQTIAIELDAAVHRAVGTGLDRKRIVVDPGLGFGKRKEQNAEIVAFLETLMRLELPIMVGASRKHFLAKESTDQTEFATAAAVTASILHGAHIVRVHDVAAMKVVAEIADDILRAAIVRVVPDSEDNNVFRANRPVPVESERRAVRPPRPGGDRPDGPPRPRSGPPSSGPPRSGPPRSGPPRSGPPRGDRPYNK